MFWKRDAMFTIKMLCLRSYCAKRAVKTPPFGIITNVGDCNCRLYNCRLCNLQSYNFGLYNLGLFNLRLYNFGLCKFIDKTYKRPERTQVPSGMIMQR